MAQAGRLPAAIGVHMFVPGLCYGLNFILAWAVSVGYVAWPFPPDFLPWLPGTVAYVPAVTIISVRHSRAPIAPEVRAFVAVWAGAAITLIGTAIAMIITHAATGRVVHDELPAIAFVIFGASWMMLAVMRSQALFAAYAAGCLAAALAVAALIGRAEMWLACAAGLLVGLAMPGAIMLRTARQELSD